MINNDKNYYEQLKALNELRDRKSGFFDLEPTLSKKCNHPDHEPPKHLHIPQGKGYRHICSGCGKETILIPPQITF